MESKTFYTVKEVMDILGIGRNTIYDMINEEFFPVIKRKKIIRIPKHAFDKWFDSYSNAKE